MRNDPLNKCVEDGGVAFAGVGVIRLLLVVPLSSCTYISSTPWIACRVHFTYKQ